MNGLQIQTLVTPPFAENTYILWRTGSTDALVVDPGFGPEAILASIREHGLSPVAILNTHGHVDHIAGNAGLKAAFPSIPLMIGVGDAAMLADPRLNLGVMFGFSVVSPPADRTVTEGDRLELAGLTLDVLDVPGHSPGHVVFVVRFPEGNPILLGGDVLMRGGIGRTDFPGGDHDLLIEGIRRKVFALPADTVVYPGHGPVTTVGHEQRTNPYVRPSR